ncbi:hypothetical protein H5410_056249 [Solanum commersonii]|uniref:Uncharacterized protein n=1 Tax=Solanum commersonii TaxID=4109 RepID=A0A9J5WJR3_SOLCO|nr:hypothetical protein H5410_056249 [Solanum commersonii]
MQRSSVHSKIPIKKVFSRLAMGLSAEFLPKKVKVQGVFKRGSHTHKVGHKSGICQIGSHSSKFPKIMSRESFT